MSKPLTFYFDKSEHVVTLYKHDRTCANQLAEGFGESIGKFVTMLANEVERLPNNGTISLIIEKQL